MAGFANALLGTLVAAAGGLAVLGRLPDLALPAPLPGWSPVLAPTPLGGFFLALVGVVATVAAVFGAGYAHSAAASRTAWSAYTLFLLGMALVPAAGDAVTFLLGWELMALGSTVLVLAEHAARPQVRTAALWYSAMTHISFVALAAGLAMMSARAGSTRFTDIGHVPQSGWAVALIVLGCATKAGMVPLHVWLPRAHPEAPSHASAVMSAAMVKLGIYGLMLTMLQLAPGLPRWWGGVLLALGAASAVYGILLASVTSDLKRLLAYSTTENVGLAVVALGAAVLLRGTGQDAVVDAALTACLLLVAAHAGFKTVLFLGAGAVLHSTGERDLDRMGGLGATMPRTALAFSVGAAGAAAVPATGGFVAEWVLLQSVIHADGAHDRVVAVAFPVATGVVALTLGLALLTFVKVTGTMFLARPRSAGAAGAHEAGPLLRAGLWLAALAVLALGAVPGLLVPVTRRALGTTSVDATGWAGIGLLHGDAALDPARLLTLAVALLLPFVLVALVVARRHPRRRSDLIWGCGQAAPTPRMQLTATSYAEPLVRVFARSLRPDRELTLPTGEPVLRSDQRAAFSQHLGDPADRTLFEPLRRALLAAGDLGRRVQNGSVHRYLGFAFATLLVVLVVVTL